MNYVVDDGNGGTRRHDIFTVNADGTALTQITDSGPAFFCTTSTTGGEVRLGAGIRAYLGPSPSPDRDSVVATVFEARLATGPGGSCVYSVANGKLVTFSARGGRRRFSPTRPGS